MVSGLESNMHRLSTSSSGQMSHSWEAPTALSIYEVGPFPKLDHGWPQSITSQARSAQRCRVRSFSLREAFVKQARDSARQGALRKLVGASWSAQVALRKLRCASCSAQVAPCKLVRASGSLQVALCKLLRASCSLQVALCKLLCARCSVQVALRKLLCASCSRQGALRKLVGASWSAPVALCNLLCASCSAQVALRKLLYASCILRRPPADQGGIEPATRRKASSNNKSRKKPRVFAPRPRRFPQRVSRAPQKLQNTSSFCTSTTPKSQKSLEFLHLGHADPRRGNFRNRKKPRVFVPRPRRSPQRVARAC